MGIVKIASFEQNDWKLISANDLKSLKTKAENKFGFEIKTFVRKQDGCEIDDDEIFVELLEQEELQLIALKENEKYEVLPPSQMISSQLKTSKMNSELNTRSSESKKQTTQTELTSEEKDQDDKEYDDFFEESNRLKNIIQELKKKPEEEKHKTETKQNIKSRIKDTDETLVFMDTKAFEKKKKEAQDEIKRVEDEKEKLRKRAEELKTLNTTVLNLKKEKEEMDKEYKKKLFQSEVTKQMSKTELEIAEARLAELELKKQKIANIFIDLKNAEKVDLCFLVDCTGSMDVYINEVKTTIHRIVDKLKKRFKDFELRCSFVGYRDHSDGKDRIAIFDFNNNIDKFKTFVSSVKAKGGADQCEDVFGGLSEVIKQDWQHMSRILFHIGDAPCHGNRFHNGAGDDYPDGHKDDPKISDLIKSLVDKQISYYFAELNSTTLKMIEEFDKELFAAQGNKVQVVNLKSADGLTETVATAITKTISDSKSMSMHSTKRNTKLKTIIVNPVINWSKDSMKKCNADYYTATYDGTISELKTKPIEFKKKKVEIYIAPKPFAKGNMRFAFNGYLNDGGGLKKVVIKQSAFKDDKYNTMAYYKEMIETQVISKFLTDTFLDISRAERSVKFLEVNLIQVVEDGTYYSIEEFFDGEFKKWMNNAGILNEDIYSCTVDTFSHWSYQATDKYLIVTDLQGFKHNDKEYILTDPAIACPESHDRFSSTNLGVKGIKKYFETHQCNHICRNLKLVKHKDQKLPDRKTDAMMTKIN